jgi:uncharacterized linocin/CFP29 family protein
MDLLRQQLAPISASAWNEIDAEAKNALAVNLSGRKLVDVSEPLGLAQAAVNLGRLDVPESQDDEVRYGIRRVLPLVEIRALFELDIWELDNVDRGARDPDLEDLRRAAKEIAKFEERAIYDGFPDGSIAGLLESSEFEPISVGLEPGALPDAVAKAVLRLRYADVEGPYALALGAALYQRLDAGSEHGYPIRRRISRQIEGPVLLAPYLTGGVLISQRGGDAEMTLGRDISIGYQNHDEKTVRLYFTESFTFRVLAAESLVALRAEAAS